MISIFGRFYFKFISTVLLYQSVYLFLMNELYEYIAREGEKGRKRVGEKEREIYRDIEMKEKRTESMVKFRHSTQMAKNSKIKLNIYSI